jgi:DNA-binding ferritin-like protein
MSADILQVLLLLRNQVKVYHWQTMSFARHKATDDLVTALDTHIDTFTEVYMGKYGRPHFTAKHSTLRLYDLSDKKGHRVLEEAVKWLVNDLPKHLKPKEDSDLLNIRDEIVADLNKARYLFTLK